MIPDFLCCLRQTKLALRYRLLVPKLVPLLVEKPIVLVRPAHTCSPLRKPLLVVEWNTMAVHVR